MAEFTATAPTTITGTPGPDNLGGGADAELIQGLGGADNLFGGEGADTLEGGDGDDYLRGAEGDDVVNGGPGGADIAAFTLPAGTSGTLRLVDGVGANAGKLLVQRVDGPTVETVFVVSFSNGVATVQGVNGGAASGTDTVVGVEDLHFYMANPTFDPNQFVNIRLAATQYGEWVSGGDVGDALRIGDFPGAKNADGRGGDDLIIGDGQDNYINGGAGSDTIDGGAGRNDIAGFQLPAGATGALRVVDGVGEYAGKLVVERVDGPVVEAVFVVTPTAGGGAVVQGINSAAFMGADVVSNVEDLHFTVTNSSSQFANVRLAPIQYGDWISGSETSGSCGGSERRADCGSRSSMPYL